MYFFEYILTKKEKVYTKMQLLHLIFSCIKIRDNCTKKEIEGKNKELVINNHQRKMKLVALPRIINDGY